MVENNHSYRSRQCFSFEFTLILRWYYNVYFHIICGDVVYPPRIKVIPIYSFFLQIKNFIDVYNLEHLRNVHYFKISKILTIFSHFDYTFFHISRHLRGFCKLKKCAIFWEKSHLHSRTFTIIFPKFNNLSKVLQQENPPTDILPLTVIAYHYPTSTCFLT